MGSNEMIKNYLIVIVWITLSINIFAQDTIHLKNYISNLKTIDVFIDGKKCDFLFDTGGGETFISPEIAEHLDKKVYGSSAGFRMNGEMIKYQKADSISFTISSTEIFHHTIGVWDIMSVLPKELPKLKGVISLKSFYKNILTIDLSGNILIVENSESLEKQINTKTLVPARFANGLEGTELNFFIGIPKNNTLYWFLFDTGNISGLLLSPETALIWGLQSNTNDLEKEVSRFEFVLGKNRFYASASSKDIIYDGALDFMTISQFVFTIDFRKSEVWIN